MSINVTASAAPITVSASGTKVDATVSGGVGPAGAPGSPATITVGTVTTGAPGSSGAVVNAGTSSAAVLNFTIPAGAAGPQGPQGETGPAGTTTWAGITDKPSTFAPSSHQHVAADISDFTSAVIAAAPPTTNASLLTSGTLPDARLSSNIARTSDVTAAVANVVNAAPASLDTLKELADALGNDASFAATVTNSLAAKAPIASPTFTGTVSGITKAMVGLGNVDNTSDANKPISTATQAALDGKANTSHSHGNITADGRIGTQTGRLVMTSTGGVLDSFSLPNIFVNNCNAVGLVSGTWNGSTIAVSRGGTGATTAADALTNLEAVSTNDARLTDAREWSAATIGQAEAEAGTATTRRAFTAQRVFQAIAAWWAGISVPWSKLTSVPSTFAPSAHKSSHATGGTDALSPADIGAAAALHAHSALTDITGLATVATSGSAADLTGTLNAARLPASGVSGNSITTGTVAAARLATHTHAAGDITSGTIATARLGSGATSTNFLRGDQTYADPVTSLNGNTGTVTLPVLYEFTRTTAPAGATGGSGTWTFTLPSNCTYVRFECIGGGAGGGSGRRGASATNRFGGGGGGGGGRGDVVFTASLLSSRTMLIKVGEGGAGGAGRTTDDADGNAGTSGGQSAVRYSSNGALNNNLCMAIFGGGGGGGTASSGTAGHTAFSQSQGSAGGSSQTTAAGNAASESSAAASGGGGGGGIDASNTARGGGNGGRISPFSNTNFGSTGGTAPGGNGGDPFVYGYLGHGGAGGAGHASGAGGSGSSGAFPGGGGGGGGASVNGNNSGAGGNGADGIVRIYCY